MVGKLLEVCVLQGWAEAVHSHLIQMALCQLYYCTPHSRSALGAAQGLSVVPQDAQEASPLLSPVEGTTQRPAPGEDGLGPSPPANGGPADPRQKSLQQRQSSAGEPPKAKAEAKEGRERKKKAREPAAQGEAPKRAREQTGQGEAPKLADRRAPCMLDLEQLRLLGGIDFVCEHVRHIHAATSWSCSASALLLGREGAWAVGSTCGACSLPRTRLAWRSCPLSGASLSPLRSILASVAVPISRRSDSWRVDGNS